MKTEYSEKYVILGLKIAYYRKKAGYTREAFVEMIGKSMNFRGWGEGQGTVRGISLENLLKLRMCWEFCHPNYWKMIK